jgi:hypothetical protein
MANGIVPSERIENAIYLIRGQKVMLDFDLAMLYQVQTNMLNRQVRRNIDRFPADFMFQLTKDEFSNLKCQFGTSSWGGKRKLPLAFTEHGVLMLSSVLNSKRAVHVNIQIMRAFLKFRQIMSTHKDLAAKLAHLEQKVGKHTGEIQEIFVAIHKLMDPSAKTAKKIGFMRDTGD